MLKPWYKVVTPREDLREGRPLDASEFAVHLDKVRDGNAPRDYQDPVRFFERTFLTRNLTDLASEVVRRLSGETTGTNAVYNLVTQFGGGKTHALTLLYHLADAGPEAREFLGVNSILVRAAVETMPRAATAVFVGTEFDSLAGRGGVDGTPSRRTPWGEMAYQLAGEDGLNVVAEHDRQGTAPAGDVIRRFLPEDRPCLILVDELMNYISRNRKSGLSGQFYNFLQNLSETARSQHNVVLVVSLPRSEGEMTPEDQSDHHRFEHMLERLGKRMVMSAESETSEIVRRRLFEWDPRMVTREGRVLLPKEAQATCEGYADWVSAHRDQLPPLLGDNLQRAFEDAYPFHPTVLSVFERKWRALPSFQQTRGVLRLLALWIAYAYQQDHRRNHPDPLIGLGTAPLEDSLFRTALFGQLGEGTLEAAVTTDIAGRADAGALRLDQDAPTTIRKSRLHRKVAATILFESNGGMLRAEATVPEIRLGACDPQVDIGNVETVLQALESRLYYLHVEGSRYRLSGKPNLNRIFSDRRANVKSGEIDGRIRSAVGNAFPRTAGIEVCHFPTSSAQVSDRPVLTLVVLPPDQSLQVSMTRELVDAMTRQCGAKTRERKTALLWAVAEDDAALRQYAGDVLAWEQVQEDSADLSLDATQQQQLSKNLGRAQTDLTNAVWRSYRHVLHLGSDSTIQDIDLGPVNPTQATTLVDWFVARLRQDEALVDGVSPQFLVRNWPAMVEWSTKAVRDAFFAAPQFPRLLRADALLETIARGVSMGILAYVGKTPEGKYQPFRFQESLTPVDVQFSEDMFIITAEEARKHVEPPRLTSILLSPSQVRLTSGNAHAFGATGRDQHGQPINLGEIAWSTSGGTIDNQGVFTAGSGTGTFTVTATVDGVSGVAQVTVASTRPSPIDVIIDEFEDDGDDDATRAITRMAWNGEIPPLKWSNFYLKVLARFAGEPGLKLNLSVELTSPDGIAREKIDEMATALHELGVEGEIETE